MNVCRVLSVVEEARPDLVTSPVVYPLAVVLLHYLPEGRAYAALAALLGRGQRFLLTTHIATEASMRTLLVALFLSHSSLTAEVLQMLIRKHAKSVYALLKSLRGEDSDEAAAEALFQWHAWIFRDLPLPHVVRVTDCFLWEGHKVPIICASHQTRLDRYLS